MNRIKLTPHLSVAELEQRARHTPEPTEHNRWQIIWLLSTGQLAREVAASTGYSAYWIGQIARRYNAEGPEGMVNRRHTTSRRATPLLSEPQLEALRQALGGPAPQGERWTSRTVATWMAERLGRPGRPVAKQRGWDYLRRLDARLRLPRPRHVAASAAEPTAFKKNSGA
jgi:transposase